MVSLPVYDQSGAEVGAYEIDPAELAHQLENEMKQAAQALDFERAARLRDELFEVRAAMETGSGKSNRRRSR